MSNLFLIFAILFGFINSSYSKEIFVPSKLVTYKKIDDIELKLHIFNPSNHDNNDKQPAIVFFFGGGWVTGSPTQFYPQSNYLASMGMIAISAEYRIEEKHGTSPKESVSDGRSALRWIKEHAVDLGIDPNRIVASGGSAGGHIAAATATLKNFNEPTIKASEKPNALVLFNPVIDNSPLGYGYERVKRYWKEFSPLHNLDKGTPPTIMFLGTMDELISVETAKKYKKIMNANGDRCDLYFYEGQKHGFFNYSNYQYFLKTMEETANFLTSLGYIKLNKRLAKSDN